MQIELNSPASGVPAKFVCVFNRARDSYQVPVGLHEAGLLEALVTDFYAPDSGPSWLPKFLRRKRSPALPARRTYSDRLAFLVQYAALALRVPTPPLFRWIDRRLGNTAGHVARKRDAHLYCYHHYLPQPVPDDRCLIVFVFHPLPQSYIGLLRSDHGQYPEVEASFRREEGGSTHFSLPVPWTRPDAIVCASGVTARSVISAGAPPERVAVIPYGVPDGTRQRVSEAQRDGRARFLFVGNGIQRKGIHHLLRAWCSRPRRGAELVVVSYDIDPAISALATDPSVRVLGYQSREELDQLFARSDVFVMPSLLEGFGLVYLEALAAGCHVIATPYTGLPDLALSDEAVTLVEPGNLEQIDAAIEAAIGRVRLGGFDRAAISAEGERWTQADFRRAIGEHAKGVLAWYEGVGSYPEEYRYSETSCKSERAARG